MRDAPYRTPNGTTVPNEFYDEDLRTIKTLAELKVMDAIFRKTYGYSKHADILSMSQLVELTGMSENSVLKGLEDAQKNGRILVRMLGRPGHQRRVVMLRNQENLEQLSLLDEGFITVDEFIMVTTKSAVQRQKQAQAKKKKGGGSKFDPPPVAPLKPGDNGGSKSRGSDSEGAQALTPQDPDLTLLVTVNSSPLSLSEEEDQASATAARVSVAPPAEPVKAPERGGEEIFEDREEEENRRERERRAAMDPEWEGIPGHVAVVRTVPVTELAPEIGRAFSDAFRGKSPPAAPPPPQESGELSREQIAAREARLQELAEQQKLIEAREAAEAQRRQQQDPPSGLPPNAPETPADAAPAESAPDPVENAMASELSAPEPAPPKPPVAPPPACASRSLSPEQLALLRNPEAQRERWARLAAGWTPEQIARREQLDAERRKGEARLNDPRIASLSMVPQAAAARQEQARHQSAESERKAWIEQQRQAELERLLALGETGLEEAYRINLVPLNPNPGMDTGNFRKLKNWFRKASDDARRATIRAIWLAKDEGMYAINAVRDHLAELGFTSIDREVAHA